MYFANSFLSPIEKRSGLPLEQAFSSGMLKCTLLLFESNSTSGITNIKEMLLSVLFYTPCYVTSGLWEAIYTENWGRGHMFVLFVCLGFFVPLENFSFIWRLHHCWWRTANFDLCSNSWPLSSEGSLTCHTYCDTGHPFIMVIFEDTWHSPIAERLTVELSLPVLRTWSLAPQIGQALMSELEGPLWC